MKDENSKKIAARDIAYTVNKFCEQKNISGEFPNLQEFSHYVSLSLNSDNSSLIARYETALIQAFDKSPELRGPTPVNSLITCLMLFQTTRKVNFIMRMLKILYRKLNTATLKT
ncbi:MAG: hypothetical protein IRD7MM_05835 [Candidatus Midichloria mitochondrii]